ncbi:MAG: MauE/DoxX family redox-associated membrane protein [Pseudomonadota bacterium]
MILTISLAIAFGALFASSAYHKISDLSAFVTSVQDYQLGPKGLAKPAAFGILMLECLCLVLLAFRPSIGLLVGACLLCVYAGAMTMNLLKGRTHIDCGCYAPGTGGHTIHWGMVLRNLAVGAAGTAAALWPPTLLAVGHAFDYATIAAFALGAISIYCILETALQQRHA